MPPLPSRSRCAERSGSRAAAFRLPPCAVAPPRAAQWRTWPLPSCHHRAARSRSSAAAFQTPPRRKECHTASRAASSAGERVAAAPQGARAALPPSGRRCAVSSAGERVAAVAPREAGEAPPPPAAAAPQGVQGEHIAAAFRQPPCREQRGECAAIFRPPPCHKDQEQSCCILAAARAVATPRVVRGSAPPLPSGRRCVTRTGGSVAALPPSGSRHAASSGGSAPSPLGRRRAARSGSRAAAFRPPPRAVAAPRAARGC